MLPHDIEVSVFINKCIAEYYTRWTLETNPALAGDSFSPSKVFKRLRDEFPEYDFYYVSSMVITRLPIDVNQPHMMQRIEEIVKGVYADGKASKKVS